MTFLLPRRCFSSLIMAAGLMLAILPQHADAKAEPASIFGSHMVLQQGMEVPVWGTADAGEEVSVSFAGQTLKTTADADGKWMVRLASLKATANQTGQTLTVTGSSDGQSVTLTDVLIGEVWLGSGQSNMLYKVKQAGNAQVEIAQANHPQIRVFTVEHERTFRQPGSVVRGSWEICTPETVPEFSAAGYYFSRTLQQELGVPVGFIGSSVGNTPARAWASHDAMSKTLPEYDKEYEEMVYPGKVLDERYEEHVRIAAAYFAARDEMIEGAKDMDAASKIAATGYDDSQWATMNLPALWNKDGLVPNAGMVWFRKEVQVPAAWAGKDLKIDLGPINAIDITWFNGQIVGQTGSSSPMHTLPGVDRSYTVPGKLVKAGANHIAVRVINQDVRGGIYDPTENKMKLYLEKDEAGSVSLKGDWRYWAAVQMPRHVGSPITDFRPGVLFNGMISPLIPYAMRGAMWYQGEFDAKFGDYTRRYPVQMTTLINDWKSRWGQEHFTFLIVQLPNYGNRSSSPGNSLWSRIQRAQEAVARDLPETELAVTIDIGDPNNIHPANKQEVGRRLALIALAKTYGKPVVYSGPVYKSHQVQGSSIVVNFDHLEGGLVQKGDKLDGFALAGADGRFVWADAKIQGSQVVVTAKGISSPVSVSYAWDTNPPATLFNKAELPARPFNTAINDD